MATIVSLVLLPVAVFAQGAYPSGAQVYPPPGTDQMNPGAPPVEQTLVPEGALALQLAQALNLGQVEDETQAENLLSSAGIEPNNGWVASYPVTPDIVAEIQNSVAAAANANRLPMGREEAQGAVGNVLANLGLAIQPAGAAAEGTVGAQASPPPAVVDNYYYEYGPPVVTYYTPPPDYGYLYAWVPYPFWFDGFFFNGFFVLNDFNRHVHFHHRDFVVSNHFVDPRTHRAFVVNPAGRHFEGHAFAGRESGHRAGSIEAHNRAFTPHSAAPMPQRSFGGGFHGDGGFHGSGGFHGAGPSGGFHGGGFGGGHGGGRHR